MLLRVKKVDNHRNVFSPAPFNLEPVPMMKTVSTFYDNQIERGRAEKFPFTTTNFLIKRRLIDAQPWEIRRFRGRGWCGGGFG
jgi:hypothetical protein